MNRDAVKTCLVLLMALSLALMLSSSAARAEWVVASPGELPPLPVDLTPGPVPVADAYGDDGLSYADPSIEVKIYEDKAFDTPVLYAHINIMHPSQLRTAPASTFRSQATAPGVSIARRNNAVVAINGDYFV